MAAGYESLDSGSSRFSLTVPNLLMGQVSTRRPVKDRLNSLTPPPPQSHTTLQWAKIMLRGFENSEDISCTIDRNCRTRVLSFPGAQAEEPLPYYPIYTTNAVRASLVCDLETYFTDSKSTHYEISPSLRNEVEALGAKKEGLSLYVVIEELHKFDPLTLDEVCALLDEVIYENGKRTPLLKGGRDNEKFIVAIKTSDGKWPAIPSNEQTVNMILAAVRASQNEHYEIRKHVDVSCLVTDNDRFVCVMPGPIITARASVTSDLDDVTFRSKAAKIEAAISCMESDLGSEHIQLLVNALYWDDYKGDNFRRLHYLSLWESLAESRKKLGHDPSVAPSRDNTVLAGKRSVAELKGYRNDIAHWWTGHIDGNYLADIYRTLNELIRRKYF